MYTFKEFCVDTHNNELLGLWDYKLNIDSQPDSIGYASSKRIWFKCPRGLHDSRVIPLGNVTRVYKNGKEYTICNSCNSIGQYIIDTYGEDYLNAMWSDKNTKSYFDIQKRSKDIIWLRCQNDKTHPDYDLTANNFIHSHQCPYCSGRRVCDTNSFGYLYPELAKYWSEKNEKTPFECRPQTKDMYWFRCENGIHEDYKRKLYNQIYSVYLCPKCGDITRIANIPCGEDSPYWKGDAVDANRRARNSSEYDEWRKSIFEKDDYTCQCCGLRGNSLNAHHLKDFATFEDLRFDISNGITLCVDCHDTNVSGSFHNIYGTHYKTPEELEEYINFKRMTLGIPIPFSLDSYFRGNILKPGDIAQAKHGIWIFNKYTIDELRNENNTTPGGFIKIQPRRQKL